MRNYQTASIRLFLLIGLIFGLTNIVHAHPEANFQIQGNEWVKSNNDSLSSDIHRVQIAAYINARYRPIMVNER